MYGKRKKNTHLNATAAALGPNHIPRPSPPPSPPAPSGAPQTAPPARRGTTIRAAHAAHEPHAIGVGRAALARNGQSRRSTECGERPNRAIYPARQNRVDGGNARHIAATGNDGRMPKAARTKRAKAPPSSPSRTISKSLGTSRSTPPQTPPSPKRLQRKMGTRPTMLVGERLSPRPTQRRERLRFSHLRPSRSTAPKSATTNEGSAAQDAQDIHDASPKGLSPKGSRRAKRRKFVAGENGRLR
ncbi:hypothetical protein C8R47DRAFT_1204597 [Mycena vitilis]|nr:hypothetical protein C8R47DRAFT_1204597 [Mycena vitilis]